MSSGPKEPQDRVSYSTVEVASRMGVSLQTVQRWVDAGRLRAWRTPGGHRRIDAASAELLFTEMQNFARVGESARPVAERRLRVMLVDDSPIDREILEHLARTALPQAELVVASNAIDALVDMGRCMPDILLTDIAMPQMDGLKMVRCLAERAPPAPRLVVVVSSLSPQQVDARGGLPLGVPCLSKPVDPQRLVPLLQAFERGTR